MRDDADSGGRAPPRVAILPASLSKRYFGFRYTVTGGATTVTVASWFTTKAAFSIAPQMHAKNSVV